MREYQINAMHNRLEKYEKQMKDAQARIQSHDPQDLLHGRIVGTMTDAVEYEKARAQYEAIHELLNYLDVLPSSTTE